MATVGMKYALVCGAREMRGKVLEVLLDLGAMELHRLSPITGGRAQRQALIRLYEKVRHCSELELPQQPPESVPDDLVGLASRLLEETDILSRERDRLLASSERQQVWGDISPRQLHDLAEQGVYIQGWRTDDLESLDWTETGGRPAVAGAARQKEERGSVLYPQPGPAAGPGLGEQPASPGPGQGTAGYADQAAAGSESKRCRAACAGLRWRVLTSSGAR